MQMYQGSSPTYPTYPSYPTYPTYPPPHFDGRHNPSCSRELSDLSSITLETDEEEGPRGTRHTSPREEPREELLGVRLAKVGASLLTIAVGCAVAAMVVGTVTPLGAAIPASSGFQLPTLPFMSGPAPRGATGALTARQLLESPELTELTASRLESDAHFVDSSTSPEVTRSRVSADFRQVVALARDQLDGLQLSIEQKNAILQVLQHMSDNRRMQNVGFAVVSALRESMLVSRHPEDMKSFVLEKLQPSMGEVRALRDQVIPASMRRPHGSVGTHGAALDLENVHLVRMLPLLGKEWRLEVDAQVPMAGAPEYSYPRRLSTSGTMGPFVTTMKGYAQEAKTAVDSVEADLASSLQGVATCCSGPGQTPAQVEENAKIAQSTASDAITEAVNTMDTVSGSLSNMLSTCKNAKKNATKLSGPTGMMTKKVFKSLNGHVAQVQNNVAASKANFESALTAVNGVTFTGTNVNASLATITAALKQVQSAVESTQGQMTLAFKEFGVLYRVYNGHGGLTETVRLYASSVFEQLQWQFNVSLPDVGPAAQDMEQCLQPKENGLSDDLKCRLVYAKTCLELFTGLKDGDEVSLAAAAAGAGTAAGGAAEADGAAGAVGAAGAAEEPAHATSAILAPAI